MPYIIYLIILLTFSTCHGTWIGFDCGSTLPNITTYSLLDSGECDFKIPSTNSTDVQIELLQIAEFRKTQTIQCKIKIHRTIYHCGIFGHLIPVETGEQNYIYDISHEKCESIHETGVFKYDNIHIITDLKSNETTTQGIDFAGSAADSSCVGSSYADHYGSYNNVFVQGTITIQLFNEIAQVNLDQDKIRLSTGTVCKFSDKHCFDLERGHTFWKEFPTKSNCLDNFYDILYKGFAVKTTSKTNNEVIYTLNSQEFMFSLAVKGITTHCNRNIIRTEHPKLLIFEYTNDPFTSLLYSNDIVKSKDIVNFDLSTYVNSKFVYVERHIGTQISDLYINLIRQKCEVERKTIQNSLALATLAPDEFAYAVMKQPGYFAKISGEVAHFIRCTPKEVKIAHLPYCFDQLPVLVNNETWFLTPKTHILTKKGKQIECNGIVPVHYKVNNNWIKFLPKPTNAVSPNVFKPNTNFKWIYRSIDSLATSGVYSQSDLQNLHEHIMFPMEKSALLNTVARQMFNQDDFQSDAVKNLLTEKTIWHIITEEWKLLWTDLTSWGSIASALIMLMIIGQALKLVITSIIRGYMLHSIYGFSIYLLGAISSTITQFFVQLWNKHQRNVPREEHST